MTRNNLNKMENANNNKNNGSTSTNSSLHPGFDTAAGVSDTVVGKLNDSGPVAKTIDTPPSSTVDVYGTTETDASKFFARPVQIATYSWSGAFANTTILPWNLWATNVAVARKLANYALFRGTLHIRVSVNGTPMQYGLLCGYYQPGVAPAIPGSGVSDNPAGTYTRWTQLRHIMLGGSGATAAELVVPFFYTKPYAQVWEAGDWSLIGRFSLASIVDLANCNGGILQNSTVTVMAWMTDVTLVIPTFNAAGPAPEQKLNGMISGPASWLAGIAGRLADAPIIGKYARASQIAASAVASVAGLFGFSKPLNLADTVRVVNSYPGPLALCSGSDTVQKLSVDPKQEVEIGPGSLGLTPGIDELAIATIAQREALITVTAWTTVMAPSTTIQELYVTPCTSRGVAVGGPFYPTPLAFAALPFQYWTGSIIYRVRVVCSPMMTGRLLIYHYPHDSALPALTTVDILNTCNACVLDITESTDVEFVVHQSLSKQWLTVGNLYNNNFTPTTNDSNGQIVIVVLNELVAPAPCSASILVSVKAGKDFRVAGPMLSKANAYTYTAAGPQEDMAVQAALTTTGAETCELVEGKTTDLTSAYFGENIASLRTMAKRYSLHGVYSLQSSLAIAAARIIYFNFILPFAPYPPTNAATENYLYFTWASWAALPFRGMRGGTRWKVHAEYGTSGRFGVLTGRRYAYGGAAPRLTTLDEAVLTGSLAGTHQREGDGAAMTETSLNTFLEVEVPYHHDRLYAVPGYGGSSDNTVNPLTRFELGSWVVNTANAFSSATNPICGLTALSAAADDFSVYEWVGVGTLTYTATRGGSVTYANVGTVSTT